MEIRGDFLGDRGGFAGGEVVGGGIGDHQGVIGEEVGWGEEEFEPGVFGLGLKSLAEGGIGADAAADSEDVVAGLAGGFQEFRGEDIDDGGLEGSAEIGEIGWRRRTVFFEEDADRGFEAAEAKAEIAGVDHAARKVEALGVALLGEAVDEDASGIAEAQELRDFIKGFASGVVLGAAEELVISETFNTQKQSVATTDDEGGVGRDGVAAEKWGEQMALDVVHGEEGFGRTESQSLGQRGSNEEGGCEAGAGGGGDGIELGKIEARIFHGPINDQRSAGMVVARGDFGNHAAELGMNFRLAENLVREHAVEAGQNGGGGFVAGGFDGEDFGHGG